MPRPRMSTDSTFVNLEDLEEEDPYSHTNGNGHGNGSYSDRDDFDDNEDDEGLFANGDGDHDDDDLYAILNLPRTATPGQITSSYRTLSRTYHPDKHPQPHLKSLAESRFRAIQSAYEVLSNPHTRAIYDNFGHEGLQQRANLEVGHKTKTPEEMRREFEKLVRKTREENVEALVRSRGDINTTVDARMMFLDLRAVDKTGPTVMGLPRYRKLTFAERLSLCSVANVFMRHQFHIPFSLPFIDAKSESEQEGPARTILNITAQMQGKTTGNVILSTRHTHSEKLSLEAGVLLLSPRAFFTKTVYAIDNDSFASIQTHNNGLNPLRHPPQLTVTYGHALTNKATGFATWKSGYYTLGPWGFPLPRKVEQSSFTLGVQGRELGQNWTAEITAGLAASGVGFELNKSIGSKKGGKAIRVKTGVTIGTMGSQVTLGATRKVAENTRVGLTLAVTVPTMGAQVRVDFSRLGQKWSIPVIISDTLNTSAMFWGAVAPVSTLVALEIGYLKPKRREQRRRERQAAREERRAALEEKERRAREEQELMRASVDRKQQSEASKPTGGLVILSAAYGTPASPTTVANFIDVTIPIAALVTESQLRIPAGYAKTRIPGIWDPAWGEKKVLRIRYVMGGRDHEVEVGDKEGVECPRREDLVV
ncbi:hypothetical protein G7K_5251-t1 [Saitoella complicata NRRL Y-17804]|uniref:J domain-containing protein n=2 Tax=Saitoella complicata (strain BCRC 22490 / CBS 7301 / JCM 7358 / NBRC 10748 / NRRL Y-17804) TaxID=698492 RepID=A0A0E9NNY4_SAICN|nr:hypothetical protein G7K_5251-t1 [Saitoella complicata NRRL Y-17804]